MFNGMPAETVHVLLGSARVVKASRGTILFVRGDPADRFSDIRKGRISF